MQHRPLPTEASDLFPSLAVVGEKGTPEQKSLQASLKALCDTMREMKAPLTAIGFYGAILKALESCQELTATRSFLTLLEMLLRRGAIQVSLLRSTHESALSTLFAATQRHSEDHNIVRHVMAVAGVVLSAVDESSFTSDSVKKTLRTLLSLAVSAQPKLRKSAQKALTDIAMSKRATPAMTVFVGILAPPVHDTLSKASSGDMRAIEFLLNLLAEILQHLPPSYISTVLIQELPPLLLNSDHIILLHVLRVYQSIVAVVGHDDDVACSLKVPLTVSDLSDVVTVLVTSKHIVYANNQDPQVLECFLSACSALVSALAVADPTGCQQSVLDAMNLCTKTWASENERVSTAGTTSLEVIVSSCANACDHSAMIDACSIGIEKRFEANWHHVFGVYSRMMSKMPGGFPLFVPVLKMADKLLQNDDHSVEFHYTNALKKMIGSAIKYMGVKNVLDLLECKPVILATARSVGAVKEARLWLLPLLRQYIYRSELSMFADVIWKMIKEVGEVLTDDLKTNSPVAYTNLTVVIGQLWATFPAFCALPLDCSRTFDRLAAPLGMALTTQEPPVKMLICTGLSRLIEGCQRLIDMESEMKEAAMSRQAENILDLLNLENEDSNKKQIDADVDDQEVFSNKSITPEMIQEAKDAQAVIKKYCKNYLPVLFNVYGALRAVGSTSGHSQESQRMRSTTLRCIGAFASISTERLLNELFKTIIKKLMSQSDDSSAIHELLDLVICLVDSLDGANVMLVYKLIKMYISHEDRILQKKAYLMLYKLINARSEFLEMNSVDIKECINSALQSVNSSAKTRLLVVKKILEHQGHMTAADSPLLTELILVLKEANATARANAYDTLVAISHLHDKNIDEFFRMVLPGLAGASAYMVSSSILALGRLLYEYCKVQQVLDAETRDEILSTVLVLLKSPSREILGATLSFTKVALGLVPPEWVSEHAQEIAQDLGAMAKSERYHFRTMIQQLFGKLLRRVDAEVLLKVIPEELHKFVKNIKKTKARADRKKKELRAGDDDDMDGADSADDDEEWLTGAHKVNRDAVAEPALADDAVDIHDAAHIGARKKASRKESADEGISFPIDEDTGKLIIEDDEGGVSRKRSARGAPEEVPDGDWAAGVDEEDDNTKEKERKSRPSSYSLNSRVAQRSKRRAKLATVGVHAGDKYKAKRAGGDVKIKGQADPHAFIPLNPKLLNKRARGVAKKQFASLSKRA